MSVIVCILIAAVAKTWKHTIIMAIIGGVLGSALYGWLHWQDTHYDAPPPVTYIAQYIAVGTTAFVLETAAFFWARLRFRAWRAHATDDKKSPPLEM